MLIALLALSLPLHAQFRQVKLSELDLGMYTKSKGNGFAVTIPVTPNIGNDTRGAVLRIPKEKLGGKEIVIQAEMRTNNVASDAVGGHVGAKILIVSTGSTGGNFYDFSSSAVGTTPWKKVTAKCSVPPDGLEKMTIIFGIQQGWGTVEFRNIRIKIAEKERLLGFRTPEGFRCQYSHAVKNQPMMRGFMTPIPRLITEKDIRDMAVDWNANLIRYQIVDGVDYKDIQGYKKWMASCLDKLDTLMPALKKYNMKVVIDMHMPPGGRYRDSLVFGTAGGEAASEYAQEGNRFLMFDRKEYRKAFIDTWKQIAARYKGNPQVYGYDLVNEPVLQSDAPFNWLRIQYDAARAIRQIDPETPIIVESNFWCSPGRYDLMEPFPLKNIIYQIHMYAPGEFTHQGVHNEEYSNAYPAKATAYHTLGLNREKFRDIVQTTIDFQNKYGAKIFVGEFSAAVWAPGAAAYLDEVIKLFEEEKWDWTYHAFREWNGWSLEHEGPPSDVRPSADNDRKQVILKYLKLNK